MTDLPNKLHYTPLIYADKVKSFENKYNCILEGMLSVNKKNTEKLINIVILSFFQDTPFLIKQFSSIVDNISVYGIFRVL